jgi:hypothetical protein
LLLALLAGAGLGITICRLPPALGGAEREDKASPAGPRYSVIETEAHNLIVTDNRTNTLYFYTTDKDKPVGSELKLRGTVDLNQIGKPGITPKLFKKK